MESALIDDGESVPGTFLGAAAGRDDARRRADRRRQALVPVGIVLAFTTLLGLLDTTEMYVKMADHGHWWPRVVAWQLVVWWSYAALTPAVRWMGLRYGLERCGHVGFVAIHLAASAALGLVHMVPVTLATVLINPFAPMVTREFFSEKYLPLFLGWLPCEVILYGLVLAVWGALDYRERARERELRASQLEAQLSTAALEALTLRLHPHFLFNSLNAVAGLVRKNENEAAIKTLAGLGDLLRYVLEGDGTQTVPLGRELAFIERYLAIQHCRFSDRLRYSILLPPELAGAEVPTLILQPIVENALKHGVARASGHATVTVEASSDGERLTLSVRDSGPGPGASTGRAGVGLATTRARLREHYRDGFRFDVESRPESGTVVTLVIPLARAGGAA